MEVKFGDKVVNFGAKGRVKWGSVAMTDVLVAYLRHGQEMKFDPKDLPEEVRRMAMLHGIKQKLHDACAENTTSQEDQNTLVDLWEQLNTTWNKVGKDRGPSLLARAIAEIRGVDIEKVMETLKTLGKEDVKKLRANPAVKAKMEEIEARELGDVEPVGDDDLEEMFKE